MGTDGRRRPAARRRATNERAGGARSQGEARPGAPTDARWAIDLLPEDAVAPPRAWRGPLADEAVDRIYATLERFVTPRCELVFSSPFELLVAVALSAHTTDRAVNAATATLFPAARTPQAIVALGEERVRGHIRGVGLAIGKAKRLIAMCEQLVERHDGEVPRERAALEALPGVGRKTASVVMNIAFAAPTIPVDTHIHRVAARLGIARTRTPEHTERVLLARTPARWARDAHQLLLLHGRYTCTALRPQCWRCPVASLCRFPDKTPPPAGATAAELAPRRVPPER